MVREKLGREQEIRQTPLGFQFRFQESQLWHLVFFIWRNAVATKHDAAAICFLHVLQIVMALIAAEVFIKALVCIVALDQSAARRVVLGDGQKQRTITRQWKWRLHQSFSE